MIKMYMKIDHPRGGKRGYFVQVFTITILTVTLILITAIFGIYGGFRRISLKEISNRSMATLRLTQDIFESVYSWVVPSFNRLTSDPVVRGSIYNTNLDIVDYTDMAQRVNSLVSMSTLIHSAYVYNPSEGIVYSTSRGIELGTPSDPDLLKVIERASLFRDPVFIPRVLHLGRENERVLSFVVYEPTFHQSPRDGCIVVNISEPEMRRMFIEGNSAVNPRLIVLNREGIVLSHYDPLSFAKDFTNRKEFARVFSSKDAALQYTSEGNNRDRILAVKRRPMGWTFISVIDESELYETLSEFRNTIFLILGIAVLLAFALIFITSYFVTRPVVRLFQHAKSIAQAEGREHTGATGKSGSEIVFLDRVLDDLGQRIATLNQYMDESRRVHQDEALRTLVLQPIRVEDPLLKDLPDQLREARYVRVDVVRLDNYHRFLETTDLSGVHAILEGLAVSLNQVYQDGPAWFIRCGDDHLAVIRSIEAESKQILRAAKSRYSHLVELFRSRYSQSVSVGIGEVVGFPEEVHDGYERSMDISEYRFRKGSGSVLTIEEIGRIDSFEYPDRLGGQISDGLLLGHESESKERLDEFLDHVKKGNYEDFRISIQILYHTLGKRIGERYRRELRKLGEDLRWCETTEDARQFYHGLFSDVLLSMESSRSQQSEEVLEKIRLTVEENLQDPGLCSEWIADAVGLSAAYVRELFRKYSGESLPGFILEKRMDLAVNLLLESRKSVKEIAEACGFQSYNYFFTAFKRNFGITPKEYRKQEHSPKT